MDWNDVEAFCCVIERGGFTAAAKAMSRPKSSVSASVSRLETEIGARLLQRTTRRVKPTEAGESLYQDTAAMFQRLREVRVDAMARGKAVAGTLRIAAPYEFGAHHLGAVACSMLERYPDLRVDLDVDYGRVDALDRRYDIVFSMFEEDPDSARVVRRSYPIARGLFAAPALLERYRPLRRPEDLTDLPAIASSVDSEWSFAGADGVEHKVPVRPRMRSVNADVRRRATVEGLGISRIVRTFCASEVKQKKLVEVLPEYGCAPLVFHALLPGRRLMPPKVRIFLDTLATNLGPRPGERPS